MEVLTMSNMITAKIRTNQTTLKKTMRRKKQDLFGATIEQTHTWLREIAVEMKTTDRQRAYLCLRACAAHFARPLNIE
jgi:hypothetical protein